MVPKLSKISKKTEFYEIALLYSHWNNWVDFMQFDLPLIQASEININLNFGIGTQKYGTQSGYVVNANMSN